MTFEETYQTYYKELYRFSYQLTQSDSDSKDLVHNVFLKYHSATIKKTRIINVKAWLYKVLYNNYLTQVAKGHNHKRIENRVFSNQQFSYDPNEDYNKEELRNILLGLMATMQENEYALLLMYYNGLKYKEIAEILKINPKSIGKTLSRTIEKFVSIVRKEYHEMFQ
jgi:RNA polymerase sigma-70 factor (ECF subfamily)